MDDKFDGEFLLLVFVFLKLTLALLVERKDDEEDDVSSLFILLCSMMVCP